MNYFPKTPGCDKTLTRQGQQAAHAAFKPPPADRDHWREQFFYALAAGLVVLLLISTIAQANSGDSHYQSLSSIRDVAAELLEAAVDDSGAGHGEQTSARTVIIGSLDRRLALQRCEIPLTAFLPGGARLAGKTTVGVRCEGIKPWTVYVPATVRRQGRLVVTRHPLRRGHILGPEDIEHQVREISGMPRGYLDNAEKIIGMEITRSTSAGTPLTLNMVATPDVVKKGQRVTVYSGGKGLQVSSVGTALANGARGARIRVKNAHSKRIIEGTVRQDGSVMTDAWH